uniref:Uncharacterized protein n=1 Tax=Rhizophora mucronata TaxID=61149 RepID=A0A2P2IJ68_RHIMU
MYCGTMVLKHEVRRCSNCMQISWILCHQPWFNFKRLEILGHGFKKEKKLRVERT